MRYSSRLPPERKKEILPPMFRIFRVLAVGFTHDYDAIVLGAWGGGAFGNDGDEIASLFRRALTENFSGRIPGCRLCHRRLVL